MFISYIKSSGITKAIAKANVAHNVLKYNANPFIVFGVINIGLSLLITYGILSLSTGFLAGIISIIISVFISMISWFYLLEHKEIKWVEDQEYADKIKTHLKIFSELNSAIGYYDNAIYHIYFKGQNKSLILGIAKYNKNQYTIDIAKEDGLNLPDIACLLTQLNIDSDKKETHVVIEDEPVDTIRIDRFESGQSYQAYINAQLVTLEAKEQIAKEAKDKSLSNLSEEMLKLFDGLDFSKLSEVDKSMLNELLVSYKESTGSDKVKYLDDLVKIIDLLKQHKDKVKIKEKISVLDYFKFKYDNALKIKDNV